MYLNDKTLRKNQEIFQILKKYHCAYKFSLPRIKEQSGIGNKKIEKSLSRPLSLWYIILTRIQQIKALINFKLERRNGKSLFRLCVVTKS